MHLLLLSLGRKWKKKISFLFGAKLFSQERERRKSFFSHSGDEKKELEMTFSYIEATNVLFPQLDSRNDSLLSLSSRITIS